MSVEQRVRTCRLLEKMRMQEIYSRRLGLEDVSTVHGRKISESCGERSRRVRGI